ncbi:MAG TPA: two-component regulator propeller domain-containing protein [Verrucomicrobiae bacterium]|jgi:ligand-binding sensor domain-containing protein/signal transduction histidine kinase|nr:two-component regulator propeller domain-containing protein [Verrucomicrobiae bacterium]
MPAFARKFPWVAIVAAATGISTARGDGPAIAGLAVGNNADGRIEVFQVDHNGDLRHRWQREFTRDWSSWSSLGGEFAPGVAIVNDSTGRLGVFALNRISQTVEYSFQKEPNSLAWSNWTTLPGPQKYSSVAASKDADGLFQVFAVGVGSRSVQYIRQMKGENQGQWSDWVNIGGNVELGLTVAQDRAGLVEVFGIDAKDGELVHCRQTSDEQWTPWARLGERILPGFAVCQNMDGRLELAGVRAPDNIVCHVFQLSAHPNSPWSAWMSLGKKMKPGIAMGRNPDGRIEIFTVNPADDMIFHTFQLRGGQSNWVNWTDMSLVGDNIQARRNAGANWTRLIDIGAVTPSYPVVGSNAQGHLEIFAFDRGPERILNHRTQINGNLNWADWSSMDRSTSQYISRTWRIDDGLPDNRIQAIAQTPDGYIWVGTRNGLARFDGTQFTVYSTANRSITALFADSKGRLWIGFDGGGLSCLSGAAISHYDAAGGLAGDCVTALCEGVDGSLWIGTTTGVSLLRRDQFVNYKIKDGLLSDSIRSVLEDAETNLWIATDRGLNVISNKTILGFTRENGLPDNSLTGLWQDVPGRLWIGSAHGLILRRSHSFYAYNEQFALSDRFVNVIRNDRQGDMWVGTDTGLSRFQEGHFLDEMDNEAAPFGKVRSLFEDREGNLWIGSENGLSRLAPKGLLVYGTHQGLSHNNITSVVEDDNGSLWLGNRGGLDQLNGDAITAYTRAKGFPIELVECLCKGRDGSLWAGGDDGAGVVQIKDGNPVRYPQKSGLAAGDVTVICEDRSSNVWIGTSQGLSCIAHGRFITNDITGRMAGHALRAIREDKRGGIWFGTQEGLCHWKNGVFDTFTTLNGLSDDVVTALYDDDNDCLWIGTEKGGLNRYRGGRFTVYHVKDGLLSDEIFDIIEDDYNWLWMTCSRGVFRVLKKDFDSVDARRTKKVASIAYGRNDGMASALCSTGKPGAWKTRDGRLWFATSDGVAALDPRAIHINNSLPSVYIEQLVLDGKPWFPIDKALSDIAPKVSVRIPPGHRELEIHYTGLGIPTPERIRFKYKLDGVDSDWVEADNRRVAYYANLRPGAYSFEVTACNNDGGWSPDAASLQLELLPHFWETWWFLTVCVLAIVGAIGGSARYATRRRMLRKLQQMQQRHAIELERTRIARDMHDELGAKLTRISFQGAMARRRLHDNSEAAGHIEKMAQTARDMVFSLDEIVWAVDPKNDNLDDLATYVCRYATGFFEDSPIRCKFVIPASLPHCRLSTDVRHNIFLAVKEALNNVLKHSEASRAEIQIATGPDSFEIRISDDGRGMAPAVQNGLGTGRISHGLENLNQRLAAIQGRCEITSVPGQGTCVRLIVPYAVIHLSD